jgi:hypothetical protein
MLTENENEGKDGHEGIAVNLEVAEGRPCPADPWITTPLPEDSPHSSPHHARHFRRAGTTLRHHHYTTLPCHFQVTETLTEKPCEAVVGYQRNYLEVISPS